MLMDFIKSVGGCTPAAGILNVSGTIIHKWKREGPSKKAERRIALWLAYNVEQERFILRNVWARQDGTWNPSADDYAQWSTREYNVLYSKVGFERGAALWEELNK